jgi:hypothetical protein
MTYNHNLCDEQNCKNKAMNTKVIYYHNGYGAIAILHFCIEHTPQTPDNFNVNGSDYNNDPRPHYTYWGKVLQRSYNFGEVLSDCRDLTLARCEGCKKVQPGEELTWCMTNRRDYKLRLCPKCTQKLGIIEGVD